MICRSAHNDAPGLMNVFLGPLAFNISGTHCTIFFNSDFFRFQGKTFPSVSLATARVFIPPEEIPDDDLQSLVISGLDPTKFLDPKYIPLRKLECSSNGKQCLMVAEPFHSPSLVFKDYSMQMVGQYVNYFLERRKKEQLITEKDMRRIEVVAN